MVANLKPKLREKKLIRLYGCKHRYGWRFTVGTAEMKAKLRSSETVARAINNVRQYYRFRQRISTECQYITLWLLARECSLFFRGKPRKIEGQGTTILLSRHLRHDQLICWNTFCPKTLPLTLHQVGFPYLKSVHKIFGMMKRTKCITNNLRHSNVVIINRNYSKAFCK